MCLFRERARESERESERERARARQRESERERDSIIHLHACKGCAYSHAMLRMCEFIDLNIGMDVVRVCALQKAGFWGVSSLQYVHLLQGLRPEKMPSIIYFYFFLLTSNR